MTDPGRPLSRIVSETLIRWLFLPGLVGLMIGIIVLGASRTRAVSESRRQYAETVARYVSSYLSSSARLLDYAAARSTEADSVAELELLMQATDRFHRIALLDADGRALWSVPAEAQPTSFAALMRPSSEEPGIEVTVPYYGSSASGVVVGLVSSGGPEGHLIAELRLGALQGYMQDILAGAAGAEAFVLDSYGNVVAHPDMRAVEEQANLGQLDIMYALNSAESASRFERMNGGLKVLSGAREPLSDWRVVLAQDAWVLYAPLFSQLGISIVALLLLFGLVAYVFDRRLEGIVIAPLEEFARAMATVEGGAGLPRISPARAATFSELRELYERFAGMADAIREREAQLGASEERWHFALEGAGDAVWDWDPLSDVVFVSARFTQMLGYSDDDGPNSRAGFIEIIHEDDRDSMQADIDRMLAGEIEMISRECRYRRTDGSFRWFLTRGKVMEWAEDGRPARIIGTHTDVTAQKAGEEALRRAADEKVSMLKEIHHRVKNNLNVASSLLSLQADSIETVSQAREALTESRNRIYSMARVHEELYKSDNLSTIDMKDYVEAVSRELMGTYMADGRVRMDIDVVEVDLDITHAVPCGIIINELLTNALRHAFPEGRTGTVRLSLRQGEGECGVELIVRDDGIGVPDDFTQETAESLGLRLVHTLGEQLDATLTMRVDQGTEFRLCWAGE